MRRRAAGIGAIQKDKKAAERFKDKGNELAETNFQEMTKQMENFRQNLEEFAREHREDIKKNPEFRKHFQVGRSPEALRRELVLLRCFVNCCLCQFQSEKWQGVLKFLVFFLWQSPLEHPFGRWLNIDLN